MKRAEILPFRSILKIYFTVRMKEMKKKIVASILVIAMTVLALVSCSGAYNCAEVDFVADGYATFDSAAFEAGLKDIKIEDGDFTTDEATRAKKLAATIYKAVADAIASSALKDEKLTEGDLDESDILYFVYYAVDEKTGNVYFTADMKESAITASSTKANHVIQLGGVDLEDDDDATEFVRLIKENLQLVDNLEDYVYEMDEDAVSASDYKPADGDVIYISYSRSYSETTTDDEGVESSKVIDQSATYEKVTVKAGDPLSDKLIAGEKTFELEIDGVTYNYSNVKFLWKVEKEGAPIATFKYTPYTTTKSVTPDNLRGKDETKPDLKEVELTYYVYPAYYLDAPSAEEISEDAAVLLREIYGSKLTADSFDVLAEDAGYIFEGEKVSDLVADIADLYNTKETITEDGVDRTNDYYKEGTELRKLSDAYNDAVKAGGDKPTDAQQDAIDAAKEALTKAQNAELESIVAKIAKATNGDKVAGAEIYDQYEEDTKHSLVETYNNDISQKIQKAVWELIESTVAIKGYPEKLLKEYTDHLYEKYENEYHTGAQTTGQKLAFYDAYENLEAYIRSTDCLNVSVSKNPDLDNVIETEAKTYLDPVIKVFVVSQYLEAEAVKALPGFIQHDIDKGAYDVEDVEEYIEAYGEEKGPKKHEEAIADNEEYLEFVNATNADFIIDDDYLKAYKKYVGKAYYNQYMDAYGECNVRAAFQFNRLFYYLTSTNLTESEAGGHAHAEPAYTEDGYLDFRTVKYTIVEGDSDAEGETEDDHDHSEDDGHQH